MNVLRQDSTLIALRRRCCYMSLPKAQVSADLPQAILASGTHVAGYFGKVWAWVADHDQDSPLNANATESDSGVPLNVMTDFNIYAARGILVESQGPMWLYGTGSEHAVLYQYQLSNAKDVSPPS